MKGDSDGKGKDERFRNQAPWKVGLLLHSSCGFLCQCSVRLANGTAELLMCSGLVAFHREPEPGLALPEFKNLVLFLFALIAGEIPASIFPFVKWGC